MWDRAGQHRSSPARHPREARAAEQGTGMVSQLRNAKGARRPVGKNITETARSWNSAGNPTAPAERHRHDGKRVSHQSQVLGRPANTV